MKRMHRSQTKTMRTTRTTKRALATAAAFAAVATTMVVAPKQAHAQEIQLTGPLAGAPPVRRLREYREGRFDFTLGPGFTLLDEYKRTIFISGRLQYNVTGWLGVGVFGGFGAASLNTDLTDQIDENAPRNTRTAVNLCNPANGNNCAATGGSKFENQVGKLKWMATPQVTVSPFRGKLALLQKLFVDTDLYLHGGVAFVGVEERGNCGGAGEKRCTDAVSFGTASRVAVAPSFGLGLSLYFSNFISANLEYRAFPFSYNRGGFDSRGAGPGANFPNPEGRLDSEDQTTKFNQMVFLGVGFHFPTTPKLSD
jgi:outer membrane beta-barrel protein